ncbi:MAG: DUF6247 family protein [Janthinobacterium lividum]
MFRRCSPRLAATALPYRAPAFEHEFNDALHTALTSFDLSAANWVVRRWWLLAAGRSQPATPDELDLVDRARRGHLAGLSVLQPDGTFSRGPRPPPSVGSRPLHRRLLRPDLALADSRIRSRTGFVTFVIARDDHLVVIRLVDAS